MDDKLVELPPARLHVIVEGRVQGVGFRYYVLEKASLLGLTGWVRNRWDDTVEVLAEGGREPLDKLLSTLHKGPTASYVENLKVDWEDYLGEFGGFSIKSTY